MIKVVLLLTSACCSVSQHAFGTRAADIRTKAVDALDPLETGLPLTLIDVFQACQAYWCASTHTQSLVSLLKGPEEESSIR